MGQNELFGELSFLESREKRSVALASIVAGKLLLGLSMSQDSILIS